MPELPEVETIRRQLDLELAGLCLESLSWQSKNRIFRYNQEDLELLVGRSLGSVERRGKYLYFCFCDFKHCLVVHLGMTGQLLLEDLGLAGSGEPYPDAQFSTKPRMSNHPHRSFTSRNSGSSERSSEPRASIGQTGLNLPETNNSINTSSVNTKVSKALDFPGLLRLGSRKVPAEKVLLELNFTSKALRLLDTRMFGQVRVSELIHRLSRGENPTSTVRDTAPNLGFSTSCAGSDPAAIDRLEADARMQRLIPACLVQVAPDPLEADFSFDNFYHLVKKSTRKIKDILLDQRVVSGIGNIYSDEILYASKIQGKHPGKKLNEHQIRSIVENSRSILTLATKNRGTSFDGSYLDAYGNSGGNLHHLQAYSRIGKPCPRCGVNIERERISGRSHYFCPSCQRI